jgi:hydroxymethylpyrimidine/phosphomethylpyrimidine kinase
MTAAVALSIAGSDCGGGAGIQADLKTFAAFGVYGASVVTALTAQNTCGVRGVEPVPPAFVTLQLETVLDDLGVGAAKTGMLGRTAVIEAVAGVLARRPIPHLVVDPVMVATSGDVLLLPDAVAALRSRLCPLATIVTPNLREAGALLGTAVASLEDMRVAARALVTRLGAQSALVTGGHLADPGDVAVDVLCHGGDLQELTAPRIRTRNLHGTGCTLSAGIAAGLALGWDLATAVATAKRFVTRAIETAPGIGRGSGPLNHAAARDALPGRPADTA